MAIGRFVERPLRISVDLSSANVNRFVQLCKDADEESLAKLVQRISKSIGAGPHMDFNVFMEAVNNDASEHNVKMTTKRQKFLESELAKKDENAKPVIKKIHKHGQAEANPIEGLFAVTLDGKKHVVEYETDTDLRDTEQIPLLEEGGVEAFFRREVLPYVPDAWIDSKSTKIGYEVSFTRYFYKPQQLRSLEEIRVDIEKIEKESDGLLRSILDISGGN